MKINREARRDARKLFRACFHDGRIDEARVRATARKLAEEKPRNALGVLTRFKKLVEIEVHRRTFSVASAVPLSDRGAAILGGLEQRFGAPLETAYQVNPELLGGVVLRVGSRVWDGSIRERLRALTPPAN